MKLGAYELQRICAIQPERDSAGAVRAFVPQERYEKRLQYRLNRYGSGPFCKFKIPNSYRQSGVYALTAGETLKYIGECADFSARFNMGYGNISPKNCYEGGQQTNCRLNNLIYMAASNGEVVDLWFYSTADYKRVELELRQRFGPLWNRI